MGVGVREFFVVCALIALASCSSANKPSANSSGAPASLPAVRAAIVAANYGEATQVAQAYIAANPKDPDGYFEDARAEALAGNQGRALDALGKAVDNGLANAAQALNDPAFGTISGDDRFAALVQRASPAPHSSDDSALSAGSGGDHVQISRHGGGTQIQAGDVKLNSNF